MSNLPSVISAELNQLKEELAQLRFGGSNQSPKPHKLVMLLAVLDLAESGLLSDNKIYFDKPLISRFEKYFRQIARNSDWCQPGPPFFHLRSSGFWCHKIREGRENMYRKLKTSGGGTKQIIENIEYTYLAPYAFSVVNHTIARQHLREFILEIMYKRVGTTFHETFSLSRPAVSTVLSIINQGETPKKLHATLREQTHLGTNYIKAMPQFARAAGLLTLDTHLTDFGVNALKFDPLLETAGTQWLMHYFMSSPHGPGPTFWHEFVCTRFRLGDSFTKKSLSEQLIDFIVATESKNLKLGSAMSTANIFVGTYEKDGGLGRLQILECDGDSYRVLEPSPPPLWAFAVALLDYWQYQFPNYITINLDNLYVEGGLTSIFMIGVSRINKYLHLLEQEGIVDVYRVAPPYQVVLLNPDITQILPKLYSNDDDSE